jgi:hypothetical protein
MITQMRKQRQYFSVNNYSHTETDMAVKFNDTDFSSGSSRNRSRRLTDPVFSF